MADTRNLFHLQMCGKMSRASTDNQETWLRGQAMDGKDLQSSEIIIAFERKFFLPRNHAQYIIDNLGA